MYSYDILLLILISLSSYPTLRTIRGLIYKRGYGKLDHRRRTALVSNAIIQKVLKKHNVICMEDVVHEIFTVGPKFKQVNNFLWPFKLSNPKVCY